MPSGLSPENRDEPFQSSPGLAACRCPSSRLSAFIKRRRAECLLRQRIQLGALVGRQAVAEPLRGRGPLGQRVQQLVHVLRVLREELAVLVHEVIEVLLGVLAAGVLVQQIIQIVEHFVDALTVLVGGVLQRLLHPGETLVEHLAAEQILDLLVLFARLRRCATRSRTAPALPWPATAAATRSASR